MNENSQSTTHFALDGLPRTAAQTRALKHRLASPLAKKPISIKFDQDVLDYFKGEGTRYQTHINAMLRASMLARRLASVAV